MADQREDNAPSPHIDEDTCMELAHGRIAERDAAPLVDHLRSCAACEERVRLAAGRDRPPDARSAGKGTPASGTEAPRFWHRPWWSRLFSKRG